MIVQTYQPDHPMLELLIKQGYRPFAQKILMNRKHGLLPPFRALAAIRAESETPKLAIDFLSYARNIIEQKIKSNIDILGPMPALMEKRAGRYRYLIQITSDSRNNLHKLLTAVASELDNRKKNHKIRWTIDVDPQEL